MTSPIIIFDPSGLTENQVKQVRAALEHAYEAGYETAKKQYQLKLDTTTTNPGPNTITWPGTTYGIQMNNCAHDNCVCGAKSYADKIGTYADTANAITNIANGYAVTNDITGLSQKATQKYCDHMYVTPANRDAGVCGKCGISFSEWQVSVSISMQTSFI